MVVNHFPAENCMRRKKGKVSPFDISFRYYFVVERHKIEKNVVIVLVTPEILLLELDNELNDIIQSLAKPTI